MNGRNFTVFLDSCISKALTLFAIALWRILSSAVASTNLCLCLSLIACSSRRQQASLSRYNYIHEEVTETINHNGCL